MTNTQNFINYEYLEIFVENKFRDLYLDSYPHFGWYVTTVTAAKNHQSKIAISLKRNRVMTNKAELVRLQSKFEALVKQLNIIDNKNELIPTVYACLIGIIGTIFIGLAFLTYQYSNLFLSLIVSLPGFTGWITPYWFYKYFKKIITGKNTVVVNQIYDEIFKTCRRAQGLKQ
ncbi:hypothetical protein [Liquorilactobacillus hordei]|uniref:Uncharacterized protein n=1 Tax=Liquorilactobacillus hordei TaxID=468911 RepID=A0A3Q8CXT6_9LACO|nr:hypothetical protein [Liquorilactobacillus hordei]AUJ28858.1 hypothetical protein BSQ49_00695 [Liquorilactobacillus hordei]